MGCKSQSKMKVSIVQGFWFEEVEGRQPAGICDYTNAIKDRRAVALANDVEGSGRSRKS